MKKLWVMFVLIVIFVQACQSQTMAMPLSHLLESTETLLLLVMVVLSATATLTPTITPTLIVAMPVAM